MFSKFEFVARRMLNCHTASVTRAHRAIAARTYPTVLVLPDGSSFEIRYHEPRKIVKLPLDLSTLSESERKERIERRKPKKKVHVEEDIADSFNAKKYLSHFKTK